MTPLYRDKVNRSVKLKPRPFVRPSGVKSGRRMERIFISNANKRLRRV